MKKIEVLQNDKNDCAAACLSSIIRYYDGFMPIEEIRNLIKTGKDGTNAYDLIMGSKLIGFDAIGKHISLEELIKKNNIFPFIAHTKKNNFYHFIVVYKINVTKNKILIMDPGIGLKNISLKDFENIYLNTAILFTKAKDIPKLNNENKLLKVIIKTILNDKKVILTFSFLSIIIFILSLIEILFYKLSFDRYFSNINILYKYLIIFVVIILLKNILDYIKNIMYSNLKYILDKKVNEETLKNIFSLPYNYYKNKTTGEIITRIDDLDYLKDISLELITNSLINILFLLFSLFILLSINTKLALVSILIMIIYIILVFLFKKRIERKVRILQDSKGYYKNLLIENIEAIESINNLNIKEIQKTKIQKNYENLSILSKKFNFILASLNVIKNIVIDIGTILLVSFGIYLNINKKITIGEVMSIYLLFSYLIGIVKNLLDKLPEISYAKNNLEKVNYILNYESKELTNEKVDGNIVIKNLNYEIENKLLLKNINLNIEAKDKLFITGSSGKGKSTLLKIIMRYKEDYKGEILINNKNLKEIDKNIINNSFTYISQNEKIFNDNLYNNISLGRNVKEEEINKVLDICKLSDLVNSKKLKSDFIIEENGFNLSGGERQRIILARALLKNSNYLIIDEALSEVDEKLEIEIIKNILSYFKDKTIIYVSHKENTKVLFKKIYNVERSKYE